MRGHPAKSPPEGAGGGDPALGCSAMRGHPAKSPPEGAGGGDPALGCSAMRGHPAKSPPEGAGGGDPALGCSAMRGHPATSPPEGAGGGDPALGCPRGKIRERHRGHEARDCRVAGRERSPAGRKRSPRGRAGGGAEPRGGECGAGAAAGRDAAKPGWEPAGEEDAGAMAAELKDARRRLAMCDHHDRTDAGMCNADLAKFRRDNGAHGSDREPGKIGAPAGHKGASHSRKPERRTVAKLRACGYCGSGEHLEPARPANRIALMLESDGRIAPVDIWDERAKCMKCCKISEAKSAAIPGTRPGLALLAIADAHVEKALTDANTADLVEQPRGPRISPSAILKARKAAARVLAAAYGRIPECVVARATFVQFDEAPVRIAGARGYVWLACRGDAACMVCVTSRSAAALDVCFPGLEDKPAVTDQYSGHDGIEESRPASSTSCGIPRAAWSAPRTWTRRSGRTIGCGARTGRSNPWAPRTGPRSKSWRAWCSTWRASTARGARCTRPSPARGRACSSPRGIPACHAGTTGRSRRHARGRPRKWGLAAGRGARPACAASP